jgi:3-methyladenine DNA glycosylase Tag
MMLAAVDWSVEFARALIGFAFVALLGGAAGLMWAAIKEQRDRFRRVPPPIPIDA